MFVSLLIFAFAIQAQSVQLPRQEQDRRQDPTIAKWLAEPAKIFMIAGLEGSGQKMFQQVWFDSFNDLRYNSSDDRAHHVLHFPDAWKCGTEWTTDGYKDMVVKMRGLERNSVWALPYQSTYPSCGAHEHLHDLRANKFHPNLQWIQKAAHEAGVKFHVIFLQRELKDCLYLTCLQRGYEDCHNQSVTLQKNAKELKMQIDHLSSEVVSCFKYYDEATLEHDFLTNFTLTPNIRTDMDSVFHERTLTAQKPNKVRQFNDMTFLRSENSKLAQLCSTLSQFTVKDFKFILDRSQERGWQSNRSDKILITDENQLEPTDVQEKEEEKRLFSQDKGEEGPSDQEEDGPSNEEEEEKWEAEHDNNRALNAESGLQNEEEEEDGEPGPKNEEEEEIWEAAQEKKRKELGIGSDSKFVDEDKYAADDP